MLQHRHGLHLLLNEDKDDYNLNAHLPQLATYSVLLCTLHDWLLMEGAVIAWRDDPSNQSFRFTISSCRPLGVSPMTRQVDDSEKLLISRD